MNQQWEEDFAAFEPVADKMVKAGLATRYIKTETSISFEWTPLGIARLKSLFDIRNDLTDASFHPMRLMTLISIMRRERKTPSPCRRTPHRSNCARLRPIVVAHIDADGAQDYGCLPPCRWWPSK
jgi:hypothetical protein